MKHFQNGEKAGEEGKEGDYLQTVRISSLLNLLTEKHVEIGERFGKEGYYLNLLPNVLKKCGSNLLRENTLEVGENFGEEGEEGDYLKLSPIFFV